MTRRATSPATAVGTTGPVSRKRARHRRRGDQRGLGHGWSFSRSRRRAGPPSRSIGGAGPWSIGSSITISDGAALPGAPFHRTIEAIVEWNARRFMPASAVDRTAGVPVLLVFGHSSAEAIKVRNRGSPRAGWRSDIRVGACWPPSRAWRGFSFGHSLPRLIFGSERPRGSPERPRGSPEGPRGTPEGPNARRPERPTGRTPEDPTRPRGRLNVRRSTRTVDVHSPGRLVAVGRVRWYTLAALTGWT